MDFDDGGPVFPQPNDFHGVQFDGLSVRDWFAGQVMGHMISLSMDGDGGWCDRTVAAGCYRLADAMIAARKGGV